MRVYEFVVEFKRLGDGTTGVMRKKSNGHDEIHARRRLIHSALSNKCIIIDLQRICQEKKDNDN